MKKQLQNVLVRVSPMVVVKGSTRGCGRRYVLRSQTADGLSLHIETNPSSQSNFTCDLRERKIHVLQVALRLTNEFGGIADAWDDSQSCDIDLEAEFASQQTKIIPKEKNNG